ncbi:MAG TPA: hypothetical protein VF316_13120 [Polyangiaceae bacterium]
MDASLVALLGPSEFLIDIARDERELVVALGDAIVVRMNDGEAKTLTPRPLRQLFAGTARAPDLSTGPTPELMPFFLVLETMVVRYCDAAGRDATDQEMERVYSELRRRPDAGDGLLQSHLRGAARLYLSMRDVSEAEYEAVMRRLARSARTFSEGAVSRNYLATLRETFRG